MQPWNIFPSVHSVLLNSLKACIAIQPFNFLCLILLLMCLIDLNWLSILFSFRESAISRLVNFVLKSKKRQSYSILHLLPTVLHIHGIVFFNCLALRVCCECSISLFAFLHFVNVNVFCFFENKDLELKCCLFL